MQYFIQVFTVCQINHLGVSSIQNDPEEATGGPDPTPLENHKVSIGKGILTPLPLEKYLTASETLDNNTVSFEIKPL